MVRAPPRWTGALAGALPAMHTDWPPAAGFVTVVRIDTHDTLRGVVVELLAHRWSTQRISLEPPRGHRPVVEHHRGVIG